MKTRVIRKGSIYYPQYKGWIFWKHFGKIVKCPLQYSEFVPAYFTDCTEAVKYIKNKFEEDRVLVVWESNTEGHDMTLEEIADLWRKNDRN
jgi:hypothetical protein